MIVSSKIHNMLCRLSLTPPLDMTVDDLVVGSILSCEEADRLFVGETAPLVSYFDPSYRRMVDEDINRAIIAGVMEIGMLLGSKCYLQTKGRSIDQLMRLRCRINSLDA